jgi:uncharacterized membrane-anchored protein YitT (DUF2179 family)
MTKNKNVLRDLLLLIGGTGLITLSLHMIVIPNNMASQGLSGLSVVLFQIFSVSPSITFFLFNIPLLILGYRFIGKKMFLYTLIGSLSINAWMVLWPFFPQLQMGGLGYLAGFFDGILTGLGITLAIRSGGSSGGSAIIALIIHHIKNIGVSKTLLAFDILVLGLAFLTFLSLQTFIITIISSVIASLIVRFLAKKEKITQPLVTTPQT